MISNPNFILYACIAKKTTILAEFNSRDADLATLASKCLEKTPPLHTSFSHTVRKKTYTFLIDDPFAYFAISDENLENVEVLSFLNGVKEAFKEIIVVGQKSENLLPRCFQGEFNPIFHQLLASPAELEGPNSKRQVLGHDRSGSLDSPRGKRVGSMPLLLGRDVSSSKSLKKKHNNVNKVDVSDDTVVLTRDFSVSTVGKNNGLFAGESGGSAKRVWKKHVLVVLSLDLIVCSILFGVWLWICRGFKCIDG